MCVCVCVNYFPTAAAGKCGSRELNHEKIKQEMEKVLAWLLYNRAVACVIVLGERVSLKRGQSVARRTPQPTSVSAVTRQRGSTMSQTCGLSRQQPRSTNTTQHKMADERTDGQTARACVRVIDWNGRAKNTQSRGRREGGGEG